MQWQLLDSTHRYGTVSRFLHWSIALLLGWQFLAAGAHLFFSDTAVEEFLWPAHKPLGTVLIVLVLVRGGWSLYNRGHRPPPLSMAARLGHAVMYGLMLLVPLIALLRQYGSGRPFSVLGIPLMPGFEGKIEWMMIPANLLHSWLGWLLLALIVGHIAMAFLHRRRPEDEDVLARMVGTRNSNARPR